jgi:hypothetical protein
LGSSFFASPQPTMATLTHKVMNNAISFFMVEFLYTKTVPFNTQLCPDIRATPG